MSGSSDVGKTKVGFRMSDIDTCRGPRETATDVRQLADNADYIEVGKGQYPRFELVRRRPSD